MKELIKELSEKYFDEIVSMRRYIHAHPELSYQEKNTSAFVAKRLSEWEIPYTENIGGFGIRAEIKGYLSSKKSIALRGDMDALPITEDNDLPFKSTVDGVMHACGHDVHTASLLGAAKILNETKEHWGGLVTLVFQPAEEVLPGGALLMMKDGLFRDDKPNGIFGQHVFPELPAGKVGYRAGAYMASTDELYVTIKGKGGHGAKPDQCIDPILIASHLLIALQQVVSRWSNPQMPTVLSFGKIIGNGATNIIPNEVRMEGTFRTFSESWRTLAHEKIIALAKGLVEGMGGSIDFHIEKGYPVVYNNPELTERAIAQAKDYLGEDNVIDLDMRTTAEDFAYYSQQMPGCFYRLGTSNDDGTLTAPVHNSKFAVNENALKIGMGLLAWHAIQELK